MRKWKDETIKYILELRNLGLSNQKIADQYGITRQRVNQIIKDYEERLNKRKVNPCLSSRVINCLNRAHIPVNPRDIALNLALLINIDGLGNGSLQEIIRFLQSCGVLP